MNVMAMNVLAAHTGVSVSFLGWTAICLPITLVLLVFCWASVVLVFKPEPIAEETRERIERQGREAGRLEALDWKVIAIVAFTFALWVASNWTGWDINAIAVLCLVLFFVPGIDVLTWREYVASVSWNIVLLIGCVQAIAGGVREQGAASWLFGSTVGTMTVSGGTVVAATAGLLPLLRLICPVGPAFIAICLIPLAGMAPALGVSPVVFAVIVGVNASTTFLMAWTATTCCRTAMATGTWWTSSGQASFPRWPWWPCTPPCCPRWWRWPGTEGARKRGERADRSRERRPGGERPACAQAWRARGLGAQAWRARGLGGRLNA